MIFDFLPGDLVKCLFDSVNSSFISQFPFSFLIELLAHFLPWDVLTCIPLAVSVLNLSPQYLHLKLCDSWVSSSKSLQVIYYEIDDVKFFQLFLQLNQNLTTPFVCKLMTDFPLFDFFNSSISLKVQGISYWNVFYELTRTDKNMQVRICLKVILTFWDYGIWVSSTSFLKKFHILASTASDRNCIRY